MSFNIRMGIPEMQRLWMDLQQKYRLGTIKKKEEELYKKWGKALKLLADNPIYPSLQTHEIEPLSRRYGMKVWQSKIILKMAFGNFTQAITVYFKHQKAKQKAITKKCTFS